MEQWRADDLGSLWCLLWCAQELKARKAAQLARRVQQQGRWRSGSGLATGQPMAEAPLLQLKKKKPANEDAAMLQQDAPAAAAAATSSSKAGNM